MLVVIDAGNTQTVIGLYDSALEDPASASDGLVDHWRIATRLDRTADEHAVLVDGFLALRGVSGSADVTGVAICSGVATVTAELRDMVTRYFEVDPVVVEAGVKTGVAVHYDNPREVGADRIANAVAAFDLYGGPTIMVDFGTATTCDAISADGDYMGGAIAPGLEISLDALYQRAAALNPVELSEPPRSALGRTTAESIRSGTLIGFAAQVDGLCDRIQEELGECRVIGTGGLASLMGPLTRSIEEVETFLTLHGLRLIYAKNQ